MVDVIIPAYNAHKTIVKSLCSVAFQTYKDKIRVYIVDDCSNKSYEEEIKIFEKDLNITLLKMKKNSGPGNARQYGIDNSNSPYILFLDSDDFLYDCFAIENLLKNIKDNDMAIGQIMDEKKDGKLFIYNDSKWCLHGKMYKRSFLNKYNIRFNDSRKSEDDSFNRLCMLAEPIISYVPNRVYLYRNNKASIINSVNDYWFYSLKDYVDNMIWLEKCAEERKFKKMRIAEEMLESYLFSFSIYIIYKDREDTTSLLDSVKRMYECYSKYKDLIGKNREKEVFGYYKFDTDREITYNDFISFQKELDNMIKE